MRRWVKVMLFPVVVAVRAYRKLKMCPAAVARRLYDYDCKRFVRNAGCFHWETKQAALARIIMAYHVIEKGLTMPRRHLDFGHAAVMNLIEQIEDFEHRYGREDAQVRHAVGCIKEYYQLHTKACFNTKNNELYWDRIESFCRAHEQLPSVCQIEVTREQFFAHNEAAFPLFSASRRTSRHYEGVVEVDRIRSAVKLAMSAPSACNRQFVKVYCVSDHVKRDAIFALQNGNRGFGCDADKLLVVTASLTGVRWPEERNDMYTNAGIFIMNLCYALHYNKIAHCILNWSVSPAADGTAHGVLGLPESDVIVALLSCGNAPKKFLIASSPRKGIEDYFVEVK